MPPLSEHLLGQTPSIVQTSYVTQSTDITVTGTAFVDIGSITLTLITSGGSCVCYFNAGASNSATNNNLRFQLVVDGVAQRGVKTRNATTAGNGVALVYEVTPGIGSHTFKMQWSVSAGTGRIRPTTTDEHASLLVQEMGR